MPSPAYCTQNDGACATCALSSYGRDCQDNAISPSPEQVKEARVKARLTQEQAGAIVGAPSRRTWQDWEAGRRNIPAAKWELFLLKTRQ